MTIMEMGALGELLGAIGVIVTLAYLAVQVKQNTRAMDESKRLALAQTYQMRADAGREVLLASLESETLLNAIEKMESEPGEMNFMDDYVLTQDMNIIVNHFKNAHFLYQRGFLPEEHWESDVLTMLSILEDPWAMTRWQEMKFRFRPSYVEAIEEALAESARSSAER